MGHSRRDLERPFPLFFAFLSLSSFALLAFPFPGLRSIKFPISSPHHVFLFVVLVAVPRVVKISLSAHYVIPMAFKCALFNPFIYFIIFWARVCVSYFQVFLNCHPRLSETVHVRSERKRERGVLGGSCSSFCSSDHFLLSRFVWACPFWRREMHAGISGVVSVCRARFAVITLPFLVHAFVSVL